MDRVAQHLQKPDLHFKHFLISFLQVRIKSSEPYDILKGQLKFCNLILSAGS